MRFAIPALLLFAVDAAPVTVDQIAVTVERTVITESQVDEDVRVTSFLNQQPELASTEQRRAAAARLVDQALIASEVALTGYAAPDEATVEDALAHVRSLYGDSASWQRSLQNLQLDESDIRRHLALQISTLRFVSFRFRPDTQITDSDIEAYYEREKAAKKAEHLEQPGRDDIRRTLIEERTDDALSQWLGQAHKQSRIVYLDRALAPAAHP